MADPEIREASDIDAAMVVARGIRCAGPHQQRPALRLWLRPAHRGVRRDGHAAGRQPASQDRGVRERRADRGEGPGAELFIERYTEAYVAEIDHFVDCVEKGASPLAGFAEAREALRLADATLEALRTGKVVRLDR
jgi:myo-inositol 2-dehydrogenase/D-chiro-inositol 1-dehydrogenase